MAIRIQLGTGGDYRRFTDDQGRVYVMDDTRLPTLRDRYADELTGVVPHPSLIDAHGGYVRDDADRIVTDITINPDDATFTVQVMDRDPSTFLSKVELKTLLELQ